MKNYREKMHLYGRIFTILGITVMFIPPIAIWLITGVSPNAEQLIAGVIGLSVLYLPGGIVEVITYGPILGTSGTYLAFITGNLINLKIPCVMNASEIAGTEINTEENEIVATVAVAFSSITTVVIMTLGIILLIPLTPILGSDVLAPAFNWVVSALFGALGYKYFKGHLRLIIAPMVFVIILAFLAPEFLIGNIVIVIVLSALITIAAARIIWVRDMKKIS